jgi:hypothetical protein
MREAIDVIMRGAPPLLLFTTMARDRRLFFKFFNSGLLDRGHLTIRQREIVIDRVTARCGAEYEWGVHVKAFAGKAELTDDQIESLLCGGPADPCWSDDDRVLIELSDSLDATCAIDDELWGRLASRFSDEAIGELPGQRSGAAAGARCEAVCRISRTGCETRTATRPCSSVGGHTLASL